MVLSHQCIVSIPFWYSTPDSTFYNILVRIQGGREKEGSGIVVQNCVLKLTLPVR